MKICMIFPTYPPNYQMDGIGDYTRILVEEMRRLGHDVYVISSGRYAGKDDKVIKIGGGRWGWKELIKTFRRIKDGSFDVVHMQYTPVTYGFGVSFKFLPLFVRISAQRILFVTTFHTIVGGKWMSRINALILAVFSHKIISTTEEITYLFCKWLRLWKRKLTQIPIGANIGLTPAGRDPDMAKAELARKYGIRKDAVIMSNFGFIYPGKGLEELILAMEKLKARDKYYLLIIGAFRDVDAAYRHEFHGFIRIRGLENNVILTGEVPREEVPVLLKASDMYVVPYSDGISVRRGSLMAGIVNALPIISTFPRLGMSMFRNGENVVLVERGNAEALALAIEQLAGDKALREKIAKNIGELAKEFDWEHIAKKTVEVYSRSRG